MRRTVFVVALSLVLAPLLSVAAALAKCHGSGVASAPFIGSADMKAIQQAVVTLPAVRRGEVQMSVGAVQPKNIETKSVPMAVRKVLPQYAGYQAFRTDHDLVIVKPSSRRLAYILPLRGAASYNCP